MSSSNGTETKESADVMPTLLAGTPTTSRPQLSRMSPSTRFSTKAVAFGIPTTDDTQAHLKEEHGHHSWRYNVVAFIHTPLIQQVVTGLLLLDILLLFTELFLLATYPHCSVIERDGLSCAAITEGYEYTDDTIGAVANYTNTTTTSNATRWLLRSLAEAVLEDDHSHDDHYAPICDAGYELNGLAAGCDTHKYHAVHTAEAVIFYLTIAILSTFFLELSIEMIALTPAVFFRQFWFFLDYVIISISLALEIGFHVKHEDVYQSFAGILVLVRIWRFVRIGHGIVEVTHEQVKEGERSLWQYVEELEALLHANNIELPGSARSIHASGNHGDHTKHLLEAIEEREESGRRVAETDADAVAASATTSSKEQVKKVDGNSIGQYVSETTEV